MKKKCTENFRIHKCYFKLNSSILAEKTGKVIFNFYSIFNHHTRNPQTEKKTINVPFIHSYSITNGGALVIALVKLRRKKVCSDVQFSEKILATNFFPNAWRILL